MERIAALVEGHTETHFVSETYANSIVLRPFPNGDDVQLSLIAECIQDAIETLSGEIVRILILLDREGRAETSVEIETYLRQNVRAKGRTLYFGIPDLQIENWIVSDEEEMRRRSGSATYSYPGDGCPGKSLLRSLIKTSLGPRDKARLLKACSVRRAAPRSPTLMAFAESVDFDWVWVVS